ncbi:MAG: hypothetical protein ACRETH_05485, partial [Steroidobacteraceae bacterium]
RIALDTSAAIVKKHAKLLEEMKARLLEEMGEAALMAFPDGMAYRRKQVDRAGYTVGPASYMDARFIKDGKGVPGRKVKETDS